jgi:amino acid adenylation domain-containing protein
MPEPLCRPVSASERLVAGQWSLLLGLDPDRLDINRSLFAVGGDSLVASRILAAVERLAGVRVSLSDFYATPTVQWTAEAIDAAHESGATVENIGSSYATTGDHGALTSTSRSIWLAEQLSTTSAHNVGAVVDITGPLAVAVLERSIDAVVRRHVALRSSVERSDDGPVRVVREVSTLVDVVDAADVVDSLRKRLLIEQWTHAEAGRRLDLTQPPHLRVSVLTLSSDRHRLVLCAHHAVVDNWALGLVARELSAVYGAELTRAPVDPPAVTIDSFAYAAWQRDRAAADAFRDATYWARRLDGYGGRLDLPVDRQRPPLRDDAGALVRFSIPADVGAGISGLALANNATPFTVMLAALHAAVHRFAAVDDIVVGVPVANRDQPAGVETVVDCLVETLATRASVDSGSRFVDHLRAVRDAWVEDFAHRHAPFDLVVESLDLPRDLSTTPLVQLMLVLQNGPTGELDLVGTTCASTMADVGTARYDLTYMLWPRDGGFDGVVEYATGLFDVSTVESFVAVFCKVLEQIVCDPSLTLGAIDVTDKTSSPEPDDALADRFTSDEPAHETFRRWAQTHPLQTAVRGDGISLTYRELDRRSDDVAIRLVAGGIGRGSIVAVASMPGLTQVVALLGVAKAGAAFVVLDERDPAVRQREVVDDAGAHCLIVSASESGAVGDAELFDVPSVVCIDRTGRLLPGEEAVSSRPLPRVASTDLMFVVYTSGSTGAPKGIPHRHETFAQFARWQSHRYDVTPASRVAMWAPLSYDAACTEMFLALCSGATLCVPSATTRGDALAMLRWLDEELITHYELVPSFGRALLDVMDMAPRTNGGPLPRLRHVQMAGEVLHWDVVDGWMSACPHISVHNSYGPTECVLATENELSPGGDHGGRVPIGRAIPGRQVLVLDDAMKPSPVGAVGSIYIRSSLLAGRYWRRPKETREAYVPDPFDETGTGTLYRTGDHGRRRASGVIEFVGRSDMQLKVRGNRVEIEEIEDALERDARVVEAAVRVFDGSQVVAYAVVRPMADQPLDVAAALRAAVAQRLPGYMVPNQVVLLDVLPRTSTNKRNRRALVRPEPIFGVVAAPPANALEQTIAEVWRQVLDVPAVDRHENFFEAGGNSLAATRVQSLLSRRLSTEIRLVDVFAYPTIADFAHILETGGAAPEGLAADRGRRRRQARDRGGRRHRTEGVRAQSIDSAYESGETNGAG